MLSVSIVQFAPHLIFMICKVFTCEFLQHLDLVFEIINQGPDLIDSLAIGWPLLVIVVIVNFCFINLGSIRIILSEPQINVFHLELILTLGALALQRFLANSIDLILQVLNYLTVLLLAEDVILLFSLLRLFKFL